MLAMYRILRQNNCAEEDVPVGASRGFRRACGFDMRIFKKLREVWQYLGVVRAAVVLVVCVAATITFPPRMICTRIKGLSAQQMRFCEKNPATMGSITDGYNLGVEECEYQFRKRRWNCTSLGSAEQTFSSHAVPGTKESAFTHAIISAGIAHAVTLACTKGNYSKCGCDLTLKGVKGSDWTWGGCSVNIKRGIAVANAFLDGQDTSQSDIALMNKHNNKLGVQVIRNNLDLQCKCHGPSGSCNMRTCWNWVPLFRKVGDKLKGLYSDSKANVQVEAVSKRSTAGQVPAYLVLKNNKNVKPEKFTNLVWLKSSPNYCDKIESLGVVGTIGRECNKEYGAEHESSCEVLCCGRGYNVRETVRVTQCLCKFYWCCEVRCKSCSRKEKLHSCQ